MDTREYSKETLASIHYYQDELHKVDAILSGSKMPELTPSHEELILSMRLAQNKVTNVLTDLATLEDLTKDQLS